MVNGSIMATQTYKVIAAKLPTEFKFNLIIINLLKIFKIPLSLDIIYTPLLRFTVVSGAPTNRDKGLGGA